MKEKGMEETQGEADTEREEPVILIQHDWEDALFSSKKEVWISCKFRGKNSIHSKLRINHPQRDLTSDDFTVISIGKNNLSLGHKGSNASCTFIAPSQTISGVHEKKIVALDVSKENFGVSVCSDNNLVVWNAKTGDPLITLAGHVGNVYKAKFFPSGIVVLSGGADMQMKIWCAKTGMCPVTLVGHKGAINDFCIVEKGRNVISVSKDGTARLWDCGKSACLGVIFRSSDALNCCAIDGGQCTAAEDRAEELSDREVGTENKILLVGSEQGFVYGVAVYARTVLFALDLGSPVNVVLLSEGKFVAGCQSGKIEVYRLGDEVKRSRTYFESNSPVLSGCLYKCNSFLVGRNDGTVNCFQFDSNSAQRIQLTGPDCDPVYGISSLGDEIFTACRDCKIRKYVIENAIFEKLRSNRP